MTPKEKFVEMAKGITRPGIDEMMAWLEETDFYDAPASTKFHGSVPGGLCAHSITVAKRLLELADSMLPDCYSRDTLLTVALFHDVCKISTYKVYTRNAKNEATGSWEKGSVLQIRARTQHRRRQPRFAVLLPYRRPRYSVDGRRVRCGQQPHGRNRCCKREHGMGLLRKAPSVLASACGRRGCYGSRQGLTARNHMLLSETRAAIIFNVKE